MEKRTLWGENSPVCCADSPLGDGALGIAEKFAGTSQSQPYRKGRQPSQSRLTPCQIPPFVTCGDIFPRSGGSLSSQGELYSR